jgi:mono/diheme cytochrome c family protein
MTKTMKSCTLATLMAAASLALTAAAEDTQLPAPSSKTGVTYASDIKSIFDTSCVKCHSGDKPKARLHMDTLAGVLKGTKEGPIIKSGDSAGSFIVKAITHTTSDHDSWMPPLNNKAGIKPLTTDQIALIRAWIDQGAK